jgi:hypothetical protein
VQVYLSFTKCSSFQSLDLFSRDQTPNPAPNQQWGAKSKKSVPHTKSNSRASDEAGERPRQTSPTTKQPTTQPHICHLSSHLEEHHHQIHRFSLCLDPAVSQFARVIVFPTCNQLFVPGIKLFLFCFVGVWHYFYLIMTTATEPLVVNGTTISASRIPKSIRKPPSSNSLQQQRTNDETISPVSRKTRGSFPHLHTTDHLSTVANSFV